jgi:Tol biopolymer transport system component
MRRLLIVVVAGMALLGPVTAGGLAGASVFPGTNGKIAFAGPSPEDNFGTVFTINPDGTHEAQITAVGGLGCRAWSPDGSRILVCVWQGSPLSETRPATANPDGSDFTLLDYYPELQQGLFCAYWSPNGARLLCNSNDQVGDPPPPGAAGIYTVRSSDGGGLAQAISTPDGFFDVGRGYSPDGSRILFLRIDQSNDHAALYEVNPDGTGLLRLSPPGLSVIDLDFFEGLVDWSLDGSRVTFAGFNPSRRGAPPALYVVNADGTVLRQVTPSGVGALSAQWSPNGRLIAFTSCCGAPQVWVVHPDGSGLREVTVPTSGSSSFTPVWSPDGTKLLFQRIERDGRVGLVIVSANGTGVSKVTDVPRLTQYAWGTAPLS